MGGAQASAHGLLGARGPRLTAEPDQGNAPDDDSLRLRARDPLLVGLLSQIIEPRSCINNDISYTFALSRGRSVRPRLHPHLLPYCQVGFCRRGPSCLPLFNAFVPCHWLSNGNQVDLKCDCNFFPLVGWVGWYLFLVKAPSAAVMPPQRPVMLLCVGAWVESKRYFRSIAIVVNFIKSPSIIG